MINKFSNYICYRVGEKAPDKFIHNKFQVSDISYGNKEINNISPREFYVRYKMTSEEYYSSEQDESKTEEYVEESSSDIDEWQDFQYTRDSAYKKLLQIKESIINGTEKSREKTIEEYKEVKKWYYGIRSTYSDVESMLKEIKTLL